MLTGIRRSLAVAALALIASLGIASPAASIEMIVTIDAVTAVDDYGFFGPLGSPLSIEFFLDDATLDEDATAGIFDATNPGVLAATVLSIPVAGLVNNVHSNAGTGSWTLAGSTDVGGLLFPPPPAPPAVIVPIDAILSGTGLVGDQILPLYGAAPTGTLNMDVTAIVAALAIPDMGSEIISANVTNVTIAPNVPEVSAAVLVGLGLAGLGMAGRRKR